MGIELGSMNVVNTSAPDVVKDEYFDYARKVTIEDVETYEGSVRINDNGTFVLEPETGKAFSKVTVLATVPSTPTQEKTVDIDENGATMIDPDNGYTLSKVIVNVNVPDTPLQEKTVNIVENGEVTIEPDAGYALSKVVITANVPQLDTSDATATASTILSGLTAYVNGSKITGTIVSYKGEVE